jgi:hypothetical protein
MKTDKLVLVLVGGSLLLNILSDRTRTRRETCDNPARHDLQDKATFVRNVAGAAI